MSVMASQSPASQMFARLFVQAQIEKKTSKLHRTGICEGNLQVDSPHKGPFVDVIMNHEGVEGAVVVVNEGSSLTILFEFKL